MARRVIESFHISIKGQTDDYEIEAIGPRDVKVDPQPFRWNPSPGLITINERLSNGENVNHSEIKQIGQALYDALFITPIAKAYGKSEAHLKGDEGIRILLHVEPRELAALPWEAMHDGRDFISGRSEDPLVRSYPIEVDKPVKKLQVRGALRVLFVGASPTGLPGLKLEEAAEQIRKLLEEPINKKRVVLDVLLNASLEDLRSKLLEDFHVFYFAGHGDKTHIFLDDGEGGNDPNTEKRLPGDKISISAEELARELEGKSTRLVFLSACETSAYNVESTETLSSFAIELAKHSKVPAVVAMQYPISDRQANTLAARFFEAIAAFQPVDVALAEARKSLIRQGQVGSDFVTSVMYLQAQDGALFQRARNWIAISFASVAVIAVAAFAIQALFFQPDRTRIRYAEETAQAEATQRAFAQATSRAESTAKAIAQETAAAEAIIRATAEAQREEQRKIARAGEIASIALDQLNSDPELGLLLIMEAEKLAFTEQVEDALRQLLLESHVRILLSRQITSENHIKSYSPDGNLLLVTSLNGNQAKILSATTGELATGIHDTIFLGISRPAFSQDGARLVAGTANQNETARIWDTTTGQVLATLRGQEGDPTNIAFSTDGDLVLMTTTHELDASNPTLTASIWIWNAKTGTKLVELVGHNGIVSDAAFSQDGELVATASGSGVGSAIPMFCCGDGTVKIWEVSTGKSLITLEPESGADSVAFSPNKRLLVTGSADGTVQIWDWQKSELISTLLGHTGRVFSVAFSPSGKLIASASEDGTAIIWDAETGQEVANLRGHKDWVYHVSFSADGNKVFTQSADNTVRVWDVSSDQSLLTLRGHTQGLYNAAFNPAGDLIVTSSDDGTARIWKASTGENIRILEGHKGRVTEALFSPDGKWIVTHGEDNKTRIWNAQTGENVDTFEGWIIDSGLLRVFHNTPFSPDSRMIVTTDGKLVKIWRVGSGELVREFQISESGSMLALFSPDGKYLAASGFTLPVKIIDPSSGNVISEFCKFGCRPEDVGNAVNSLSFSSDSRYLAIAIRNNTAYVWDLENLNKSPIELSDHTGRVIDAVFNPNGNNLITFDGWSRVWDLTTGSLLTLARDQRSIVSNFDPSGKFAVTAIENVARIWEPASGDTLIDLKGHEDKINSVVFSPDGKLVLTASADGTARIFVCEICVSRDDLLSLAKRRITRNLTCEERRIYLGEEGECASQAPEAMSTEPINENPVSTPASPSTTIPTGISQPKNTPSIPTEQRTRPNGTLVGIHLERPPSIDGNLNDWSTDSVPISKVVYGAENYEGTSDLSASVMIGWDETNLYLGFNVVDDRYVQETSGNQIFKGDSLEVLFDSDLAEDFLNNTLNSDDFQLGISLGHNVSSPENYLWFPAAREGRKNKVETAGIPTTNGYSVEVAIPWSIFQTEPSAGAIYGFAVSVSDNDQIGSSKQQTMISTAPNRNLADPTSWGNLQLVRP